MRYNAHVMVTFGTARVLLYLTTGHYMDSTASRLFKHDGLFGTKLTGLMRTLAVFQVCLWPELTRDIVAGYNPRPPSPPLHLRRTRGPSCQYGW